MISILSLLVMSQPASARNVQRFFVQCADDTVHLACSWPECNDVTAAPYEEEMCADRGGVVSRGSRVLRHREIEGVIDDAMARLDQRRQDEQEAERRRAEQIAENERRRARYEAQAEQRAEEERKAEERRRAAEERRLVSEQEMQACREHQTVPLRLWACPQSSPLGWYVADPLYCWAGPYPDTPAPEHAVMVDFGVNILPIDARCEFTYPPSQGGYFDFTGADVLQDAIDQVNSTNDGYISPPEWLTVDLKTPVDRAYLAMEQAHTEYLNSRPYDCLGGLCLNVRSSGVSTSVVNVALTPMQRSVVICENRIVGIDLYAGWVNPNENFTWTDLDPRVVQETYTDGTPAGDFFSSVVDELFDMGWVAHEGEGFPLYLWHPDKQGLRQINFERSDYGTGWYVSITTLHPSFNDLCESKRREGL